jgi:hypothetical protein
MNSFDKIKLIVLNDEREICLIDDSDILLSVILNGKTEYTISP